MITGSKTVLGTCGNCGGPVSVPTVWMSVIPPEPHCEDCGATVRPDHGPTLPMNPPARQTDRREQQRVWISDRTTSHECCIR